MLHRLIHKSPVPLESQQYDNILLRSDGRIRRRFVRACDETNTNLEDLMPKKLQDFAEKDLPENIQILRYNEYENKRRAKIEALRDLILEKHQRKRAGTYNREDLKSLFSMLLENSNRKYPIGLSPDLTPKLTKSEVPTPFYKKAIGSNPLSLALEERIISADSSVNSSVGSRGYLFPLRKDGIRSNRYNNGSRVLTMSIGYSEDDEVIRMIEEDKRRKMIHRSVHKERQLNASVVVTKKEEEYREKLRKDYTEKEEKWYDKKFKMLCLQKEKKYEKYEESERERKYRLEREKKEEEIVTSRRQNELTERLEQSEKKRKEENEKKNERYKEINRIFQERHRSAIKKKTYEEELMTSDLQDLERKLAESQERKDKHIKGKRLKAMRTSVEIEDKIKKVLKEKESEEKRLIQQVGEKLEKEKNRTLRLSKRRETESPSARRELEFQARLMEIKEKEKNELKKLADEQQKKEKKAQERIHNKKASIDSYIAERREIWNQKINRARQNTILAAEVYEKWLDDTTKSRRNQTDVLDRVLFSREAGYDRSSMGKDSMSMYSWKS